MRKKAIPDAALALLCFCAACSLSMDFAPAAVPDQLISRAGQALGNLAMSLYTHMLPFAVCFAACLALALFLRKREKERPGALFHICCVLIGGIWLMAQGFRYGYTLELLKAPAGQPLKSALYLIGSIFLLELAGRALLLFLDSGADLPACGGKLCGLFRRRPFAAYFVCFLIGKTSNLDFGTMISNPGLNVGYLAVVVVLAFALLSFDLQSGLERVTKIMMICLTYDHRILNGTEAAMFSNRVKELLEHPYRLLS